jgi:5-methylcytosine-specific restriction endonuclease McrA
VGNELVETVTDFHIRKKFPEYEGLCNDARVIPKYAVAIERRRINKLAKLSQKKVLTYQKGRGSQATVKRHYIEWRSQQNPPIPNRCDNPSCVYYKSPLEWNDTEFTPVLDHKNGVSGDNRHANLQLLCPNCNSQQPTHGGGNKAKVKQSAGGFGKMREGGGWDYELPAEPGEFTLKGGVDRRGKF